MDADRITWERMGAVGGRGLLRVILRIHPRSVRPNALDGIEPAGSSARFHRVPLIRRARREPERDCISSAGSVAATWSKASACGGDGGTVGGFRGRGERKGRCWHPCRGAGPREGPVPVVSLRSTTGYRLASLRDA